VGELAEQFGRVAHRHGIEVAGTGAPGSRSSTSGWESMPCSVLVHARERRASAIRRRHAFRLVAMHACRDMSRIIFECLLQRYPLNGFTQIVGNTRRRSCWGRLQTLASSRGRGASKCHQLVIDCQSQSSGAQSSLEALASRASRWS
jgi:hypothetical protein